MAMMSLKEIMKSCGLLLSLVVVPVVYGRGISQSPLPRSPDNVPSNLTSLKGTADPWTGPDYLSPEGYKTVFSRFRAPYLSFEQADEVTWACLDELLEKMSQARAAKSHYYGLEYDCPDGLFSRSDFKVEGEEDSREITYGEIQDLLNTFRQFSILWRDSGWMPSFDIEIAPENDPAPEHLHMTGSFNGDRYAAKSPASLSRRSSPADVTANVTAKLTNLTGTADPYISEYHSLDTKMVFSRFRAPYFHYADAMEAAMSCLEDLFDAVNPPALSFAMTEANFVAFQMGHAGAKKKDEYGTRWTCPDPVFASFGIDVQCESGSRGMTYEEIQEIITSLRFFSNLWKDEDSVPSFDIEFLEEHGTGPHLFHVKGSFGNVDGQSSPPSASPRKSPLVDVISNVTANLKRPDDPWYGGYSDVELTFSRYRTPHIPYDDSSDIAFKCLDQLFDEMGSAGAIIHDEFGPQFDCPEDEPQRDKFFLSLAVEPGSDRGLQYEEVQDLIVYGIRPWQKKWRQEDWVPSFDIDLVSHKEDEPLRAKGTLEIPNPEADYKKVAPVNRRGPVSAKLNKRF